MKKLFAILAILSLTTVGVFAAPVTTLGSFKYMQPGDTATASDWNTYIVGAYSYLNTYVAGELNKLTTKGDMYGYGGTSGLERLAVGTNAYNLKADSTATPGVSWSSNVKQAPMTTKGDLVTTQDGTSAKRLAVGTDTYYLTADSTATNGISWQDADTSQAFPKGTIVPFSPAAGGSVPSGWGVCDGTTQSGTTTPNLIGLFVIGGRPGGSSATAAATGYGAKQADTAYGALTHSHNAYVPETNFSTSTNGTTVQSGTGSEDIVTQPHIHSISGYITFSSSQFEPSNYALVYICKLN